MITTENLSKIRAAFQKFQDGYTAVLVKVDNTWRFHTLHWAMPVD